MASNTPDSAARHLIRDCLIVAETARAAATRAAIEAADLRALADRLGIAADELAAFAAELGDAAGRDHSSSGAGGAASLPARRRC